MSSTSQPNDGLGDGTATTPTVIHQDVDDLTLEQAVDYRRELIVAICHPGIEYDLDGPQMETDEAAYKQQLLKVEDYIGAFGKL
jgi:hypothetical protein